MALLTLPPLAPRGRYAHVYVDASVACSALDTEKDLGWRIAGQREQLAPGMVAARHFNNVQIEGDYVIKTAAISLLRGEIFFYDHLPKDIAHLFPALVSSFCAEPKSSSGESSPRRSLENSVGASPGASGATVPSASDVATKLASEEEGHDAAGAAAAAASAAGTAPVADDHGVASLTLQVRSHLLTSPHISSHLLTYHHISSHLITSHHISSLDGDPRESLLIV